MKEKRILNKQSINILKALDVHQFSEDNFYQVINYLLFIIDNIQKDEKISSNTKTIQIRMIESVIEDISFDEEIDFEKVTAELQK